jgi:hypothetical protein
MKIRAGIAAAVAFLVALGVLVSAQLLQDRPVQPPIVLSGSDVGFRVEGQRGDAVTGTLVVRVDGKWIDAQLAGRGTLKLSAR